jgi:protein involved in polysaccharide export with SLBB domain
MKSAFSIRVIVGAIVAISSAIMPIPAGAQSPEPKGGDFLREEGGYSAMPYKTYAEFALDMFMRHDRSRGLGININPDEYIVGPGDQFSIYFVPGDISDITCRVGVGGNLFIKSVGSVESAGITLGEALQKIKAAVQKSYTGTDFDVQLTDFRYVQINVIGEVARPRIYYAPAVWRVSEVIDLAGGLTADAASRKISLQSDQNRYEVDLVRFHATGDPEINPFICKGSTVIVPGRQALNLSVTVSGLVNRPGSFSADGSDRISDFTTFAHGSRGNLGDMMVVISSGDGGDTRQLDGADPSTLDFMPLPGDNVTLVWKDGKQSYGEVTILGEVTGPGRYPIKDEKFSLKDLLTLCGGVTKDGCSDMIQIYRMTRNQSTGLRSISSSPYTYSNDFEDGTNFGNPTGQRGLVSCNPRFPRDASQLMLADGDSIFVPYATGMVSVTGAVASPGLIPLREGKDVDYYLSQAGGLGFDADRERMHIFNPLTGGSIGADKADELFDGETLFVPRKESNTKP